jgi:sulfate transport system ATP-binding protein
MGFIGPVTKLGDAAVRPHDLDILTEPAPGAVEAQVDRVVHLGFEVRVDLLTGDGVHLWAQLTRLQIEELELEEGQIVYVRPSIAPRGAIAAA